MINEIKKNAQERMDETVEQLKNELSKVRTGGGGTEERRLELAKQVVFAANRALIRVRTIALEAAWRLLMLGSDKEVNKRDISQALEEIEKLTKVAAKKIKEVLEAKIKELREVLEHHHHHH
uniref:EB22 n=1 Tax=synthetic construct TaxID=32630 RepID=UPI000BACEBD2|nr:Chain B, EB22 [synthetic construct]